MNLSLIPIMLVDALATVFEGIIIYYLLVIFIIINIYYIIKMSYYSFNLNLVILGT